MKPQKYGFKVILFISVLIITIFGGVFSFISQGDFSGSLSVNNNEQTGDITIGDIEYGIGDRSFKIAVNDSSLGALGTTYNSTYKMWNSVNLIAVPNAEVMFLAWKDASKGYISSALNHKLTTSSDYNITAVFAKFGGNNTQDDPFTVDSAMAEFDKLSTNISVSLALNRSVRQLYFKALDGYTFTADGAALTANNGVYSLSSNGTVTLIITNASSKTLTITITGQGLNNIQEGSGTSASPYMIYNQAQLADVKLSPSSYFKLGANITLSGTWTPISAFSGNFNGGGYTISNLKITSGSNIGLFTSLSNATVSNFKLLNADIRGAGNVGAIAGAITSSTLSNIEIEANIAGNSMVGGFGGDVDKNSTFSNMTIKGNVINHHATNCSDVGGFAGRGGKYTDCIMYANVEGNKTAGGFVGGYQVDSTFTRCYMAGSVHQRSGFDNNYPYIGIANGYGAWSTYTMSNSGQRINVSYTSSQTVTQIDIFNASESADGLSVEVPTTLTNGKYNFTADAIFTKTHASLTDLFLASEVNHNGIVSNFGGMTIRFKMADGTYKYVATLDKKTSTFRSNFDLNLDNLTSYVDNFANMTFNTTENSNYKTEKYNSKDTSIFGTIQVDNANDFEHIAWVINGGIPTTFGTGTTYYINSRTGATMSIKLMADIDLTSERVVNIDGTDVYLNRVGGVKDGALINNFFGLGNSEMMPYRGNIYGNNHTLKVNLDMPESYNVGIINVSTEEKKEIQIKDLTIEGTIIGRDNVGIVGFFDSYERDGNIRFTNVVNKANIIGTRWTGGFLGNGHEASVYFDGCTQYGSVTGRAYTRTDPMGYKENMASTDVGGFVGETYPNKSEFLLTVNFINRNKVYGPVNAPNVDNTGYFIGACSTSTYVLNTGASNELYYTIDVKQAGLTITINETSYTSNEDGIIYFNMGNVNRPSEMPAMSYTCDLLNTSATITTDPTTLYTQLAVPISIDFASSGNVYEITSSSSNFLVNMVVGFSNNTSTTIQVLPKLDADTIASNQLIFNNAQFTHATYKIPSTLTANLKRITSGVEDYVTKYNILNNLASGSAEFKNKYTIAKTAYDTLVTELDDYTSDDLTRFNEYIANTITNLHNVDASKAQLDAWANKIVNSVNTDNLQNLNVDYGTSTISKSVTLTFMDATTLPVNVVFSLTKRAGYLIYDGSGDAHIVKYNEKITYTYNPTLEASINPRELSGLSITSKSETYNGKPVTVSAVASNIESGDEVVFIFDYSGKDEAVNVGSYTATVKSLGGKDGIYYSLPETQTGGNVTISKLALSFTLSGQTTFTYNKQEQAPTITGQIAIDSEYELKSGDYIINYQSSHYNSQTKPINAGEYTAIVSVNNNFSISGNSQFEFVINQKSLTGLSIEESEVEYIQGRPNLNLVLTANEGVEANDVVNVTGYNIYNSDGQLATAFNTGSYSARLTAVDNGNYTFANLRTTFTIIPTTIDVTISDDTSVYGDEIKLDDVTYTITNGTLYTGDNLNIVYAKEDGVSVGDYDISATYNNSNYIVNFTDGNYSITARTISFVFPEYQFTYNSSNQIDSVNNPTINNLADGDTLSFVIYCNNEITNTVKNAGDYRIALDETLEVLGNYIIEGESYKNFKVDKKVLTINANALQQEYKEALSQENFSSVVNGLEGEDKITDLGVLVYNLTQNGSDVDVSNDLVVDNYEINVNLSNTTEVAENYAIEYGSNKLDIVEGSTSLNIDNLQLTKIYSASAVSFSPKMYNSLNEEITATFTYVYKNSEDEVVDAPINVGTYKVEVTGNAGSNYKTVVETYNFTIVKNKVSVAFSNLTHTYDKQDFKPTVTITLEQGLSAQNYTTIKYYLDEVEKSSTIDVDEYKVVVSLSDTDNFEFITEYQKTYSINKEKLTIKINGDSSVYGDEISLDNVSHTITSGTLYTGDELNITYTKEVGVTAGDYAIKGSYSNGNYDVTFVDGNYNISKREISFVFPKYDFTYTANNQIAGVINPTVNNLADGDTLSYIISKGSVSVNEIINAGIYRIALDTSLAVLDNYSISGNSYKDFEVKQRLLKIVVNDTQRNFSQALSVTDFVSSVTGLQGGQGLTDIGIINYTVTLNGTPVEVSNNLAVNDYVITATLNNLTELASNYDIQITSGMLYIIEGETYVLISNDQLTKIYNGDAISFTAGMFTNLNEELDATFTYVYKNSNNEVINAPTNVGTYKVEVTADAGSNYEKAVATYTFNIVKNKVNVIFSNLSHVYNKQDFKPTVTITMEEGLDVENYTTISYFLGNEEKTSTIDVNDYKVLVTLSDVDNFEFATTNQTAYSITQAQVAVTISNATSVYGDEISLKNVTYSITSGTVYLGDDLGITYTKNTGFYAGDYTIKAESNNDNYLVDFTFGTYTISKRSISFVYPAYDFTYNGKNQIDSLTKPTVNNLVTGDELSYKLSRNNATTTSMIYVGTYVYSLDRESAVLSNYEIVGSASTIFTLKPRALTITPNDKTYYYKHNIDVSDFTSSVVGLQGSDKIEDLGNLIYSVSLNDAPVVISNSLSVNDYTLIVDLENKTNRAENYTITLKTGMLYILPRDTFAVISGEQLTKVYNASPVSFNPVMYDDSNNIISATFTYVYKNFENEVIDAPINVGTYKVEVTSNAGGNYNTATQTYTFNIIKNKVSVSFNNLTHVYNKQDFKPIVTITLQEGLVAKDYTIIKYYQGEDEKVDTIEVGNYKVVVELNDVDNFEFTTSYETNYNITVRKLNVLVGNASSTYGSAISLENVTYTITSGVLYDGDDLNIKYTKEDGETVGTYAITATFDNDNYDVTFTNGVYSITANEIELDFAGSDNLTYTGSEFDDLLNVNLTGLEGVVTTWYTDEDGEEVTSIVDAGTYNLKVKLLDVDNYKFKDETETILSYTITVASKVLELTIETKDREYNGNAYNEYAVKVSGEVLDNKLFTIEFYQGDDKLTGAPIDSGNYIVKVVEKDKLNYKFTNNTKSFVIEQRLIELVYGNDSFVYNRLEQKTTVAINNVVNSGEVTLVLEYTGGDFIASGDYMVEVKGINGSKVGNYKLPTTGLTCNFEITIAKVSVVYGKLTHTYLGRQLLLSDLSLRFTGDINVYDTDYSINELPTNVGDDYEVVVTSLNSNIEFSNTTASLVIEPATITGITLASVAYPFDGGEKSLSVNTLVLFDGSKASVEYINNSHSQKGVYQVTAVLTNPNFNTLTLEATLTINTRSYSVAYVGSTNYTYSKEKQGMTISPIENQSIASLVSVKYVGINDTVYESVELPVMVGKYKIVVSSSNTDNVVIANPEYEFTISPKAIIFRNITDKEVTYDSQSHTYSFEYTGVISGDEVYVNSIYNGSEIAPTDVNEYTVMVGKLSGKDSFNYTYDVATSAKLNIIAKIINVSAIAKEVVYGDADVELTYVADDLYGDDKFTGSLVRSAGRNVNEYTINIGTLSAGNNYKLVFSSAKYKITQRPITFECENRVFTYDGQEKQPNVTINNFAYDDTNVALMSYIGNKVNAGSFIGEISILNSNYKLPADYSDVVFTIEKKDISNAIIGLIGNSANYTGNAITPMVMIDEVDGQAINYRLSYKVDDTEVEEIKNAAVYNISVIIDELNYKGGKDFTFTVNTVDPEYEEINNSKFMIYSYKIIAPELNNAMYKLGDGEWVSNNVFDNLTEDTTYVIAIKILATQNTNAEDLGEFKIVTGLSAATVNAMFSHIDSFAVEHISAIKLANKSLAKVSQYEIADVDTEQLSNLVYAFENYLNILNSEVTTSNMVAKNTLGNLNVVFYVLNLFTMFILLLAVIKFRVQ